jgi:uncharacterized tellurite resistance protein B-like protein
MNHLENFNHPIKKQNEEFFVHLVKIALADGIIWHTELELLHQMGKKLGFTEPEIKNLIEVAAKQDHNPLYELAKRFEQLYDVVKMTLADGQIDNHEMRLANEFAAKSGFKESEIPALLVMIMRGIKEGKDEEDIFEAYKKTRKLYKDSNDN